MIKSLKVITLSLSLIMCGIAITTSLQSNLFKEWNYLASIPWMRATLWDFYFNIALLSGWMLYKEDRWLNRGLWLISFIGLGSIATMFYVHRKLCGLKNDDSLDRLFSRN